MEEKSAAIRQHKIVLENRSVGTITGKGTHNPEDPANETRLMGLKIHD